MADPIERRLARLEASVRRWRSSTMLISIIAAAGLVIAWRSFVRKPVTTIELAAGDEKVEVSANGIKLSKGNDWTSITTNGLTTNDEALGSASIHPGQIIVMREKNSLGLSPDGLHLSVPTGDGVMMGTTADGVQLVLGGVGDGVTLSHGTQTGSQVRLGLTTHGARLRLMRMAESAEIVLD